MPIGGLLAQVREVGRLASGAGSQTVRAAPRPSGVSPGVSAATRAKAARAQTPAARRRRAAAGKPRPSGVSPGVSDATRAKAARAQTPAAIRRRQASAARARVLREIDEAIAPPARRSTPQGSERERALRAAYADARTQTAGAPARFADALDPVARRAEPFINFTEMITEPLTTPAKVTGNLIAGKPGQAARNLVSAGYWGEQRFPSEALRDRGLLGDGPHSRLAALVADVGPSFAIPGFKSTGRARGETAARQVSRDQRLGRVEATPPAPKPNPDTRRPSQRAKDAARARQGAAVRRQPGRGPDVPVRPTAPVVRQRPLAGGAGSRGAKPQPARQVPRRPVDQMPYPPTRRVQRAAEEARAARAQHAAATAPQPTRLQAARAGQRVGAAQAALRTTEAATLARIRSRPHTPLTQQRAQLEARFPVTKAAAGGVTPRTRQPPRPRPAQVPYSRLPEFRSRVDDARSSVRALLGGPKPPSVAQVARAADAVKRAQAAVASLPSRGYGLTARQSRAYTRLVGALGRVVALRQRSEGGASPRALVAAGRELEAAERAVKVETRRLQQQITAGRARHRAPVAPAAAPSARQLRAAAPAPGRSVFDQRPRTVTELRRSAVTPLEGRRLPAQRIAVNQAERRMKALTGPGPTPAQAGAAGARLAKASRRLAKAEKAMWRERKKATRPAARLAPTPAQRAKHREFFTGSREREWIDANMDYEMAFRRARDASPVGVNVTAPWRRRGEGVTLPLASIEKSQAFRRWLGVDSRSRLGRGAGDALRWYYRTLVSRYGPNQVVRQGAIAADDIARAEAMRTGRWIQREANAAKLTDAEMKQATAWLEGTTSRDPSPKVKAFAAKMAALTEEQAAAFIRAGGTLKRIGKDGKLDGGLDRQYVYHLLPREELDSFLTSGLARRQLLYGKRPGFTKQRQVLTIQALKAAGFHPIERLDQLTYARAMAHHRAMADMELSRSVERRFAHRGDGDAPSGWQSLPSQFTAKDTLVPPDVAATMRNVIAARMSVPSTAAARAFARVNSAWKEWALMTPGYDIRNQFGDSVLTFQATVNPLAPVFALYHGVRQGARRRGDVGGRSPLSTQAARNIAEAGNLRTAGFVAGEVLRDVNRPAGPQRGVAIGSRPAGQRKERVPGLRATQAARRGVFAVRQSRESANRSGVYMRELRKGEGPVHAMRRAKDTLYDYSDVGRAVDWARRYPVGAPFLTWTAKNLPRQLELAAKEPAQLSAILTAIESANRHAGPEMSRELLPDYERDRMPVPIPRVGQTIFDLPLNSLNRIPIPNGRVGETGRQWFNELGVAPKLGVMGAFDVNPLTGQRFRGVRPAGPVERVLQDTIAGPEMALQRQDGEQVPVPGVDDRLAAIASSLFPPVGSSNRVAGRPGMSWVDSASSTAFGVSRTPPLNVERAQRMLRSLGYEVQREDIPEFRRRMRANAPNWRDGDPIPKPLQRQYREILRKMARAAWLREFIESRGRGSG